MILASTVVPLVFENLSVDVVYCRVLLLVLPEHIYILYMSLYP